MNEDTGVQRFASRNLEEARAFISDMFCAHRLRPYHGPRQRPSKAAVHVRHLRLGQTSMNQLQHGLAVSIEPVAFEDFYLLQMPLSGSAVVERGGQRLEVKPGEATLCSPDEALKMVWSEDCEKLILRIEREAFEGTRDKLFGRSGEGPLRFDGKLDFRMGKLRSLGLLLRSVASDLFENGDSLFTSPLAIRQLEDVILSGLLTAAAPPGRDFDVSHPITPKSVKRAEDYMMAHADKPIGIAELVAVSGVSARTLYYNFRSFRGQTPMRFLKKVRLERVRSRLLSAAPGDTVTRVAVESGFSQLGRFAADYRREFGELPSETLRRGAPS